MVANGECDPADCEVGGRLTITCIVLKDAWHYGPPSHAGMCYPDVEGASGQATLKCHEWYNQIGRMGNQMKIACLNVQNLVNHVKDVTNHRQMLEHDLSFLSESWIANTLTTNANHLYRLTNNRPNFISIGNGKCLSSFRNLNCNLIWISLKMLTSLQNIHFLHYTGIPVPINFFALYLLSTCTHDNDCL